MIIKSRLLTVKGILFCGFKDKESIKAQKTIPLYLSLLAKRKTLTVENTKHTNKIAIAQLRGKFQCLQLTQSQYGLLDECLHPHQAT